VKRPFAFVLAFLLTAGGARAAEEVKKDEPGVWKERNSNGKVARISRDTNDDGKPDYHQLLLQGRMLILREYDTNFDGKIDRRRLVEWATIKYGPGLPETPGYKNIWREEDTNFDGVTDVFTEKGKQGVSDKIGKPMDTTLTPIPGEGGGEGKSSAGAQRLVDTQNEKYGLKP
jgi:hypothetical protein